MAKKKTIYHCTECGAQYPKWQGFCSQCGVWNSIEEEEIVVGKKEASSTFTAASITTSSRPVRLQDIEQRQEVPRPQRPRAEPRAGRGTRRGILHPTRW